MDYYFWFFQLQLQHHEWAAIYIALTMDGIDTTSISHKYIHIEEYKFYLNHLGLQSYWEFIYLQRYPSVFYVFLCVDCAYAIFTAFLFLLLVVAVQNGFSR